jgi:arylsulfatase A-like enzyme/tetratricopeptide (TPR) repeat protein
MKSLGWGGGLVLGLGILGACRGPERIPAFPGAPVVLVSIDTLRADQLPAYGYRGLETPHLDRFRRDAILFEEAYSPCPMTLPTHVSMLTGLLPAEHGVRNNVGQTFDGRGLPSLPRLLQERGYATGAAVSAYVLRGETGLAALFDYYEDSIDARHGLDFADQQRPGGVTAGFAKRWIGDHGRSPFFFFFHIYEPHVPYDPPEPFRSRYANPYDGEIAAADAVVGDLLDDLRRVGVYDRAVILVTSDHGEGLGDHGEDQHSILLYREAIRVPLLLKLPGSRLAGRTVAAPAQLIDILPTVTTLVGIEAPGGLGGRSLLDKAARPGEPIYSETLYPKIHLGWSELRSVVDGRYHYIHGPRPELYDMVADPGEKNDLVVGAGDRAALMKTVLDRFPAGPEALGDVDPATMGRLAALGYVGAPRVRGPSEALPNPKDSLRYLDGLRQAFRLAEERRHEGAAIVLAGVVRESPAMVEAWIKLGEELSEMGSHAEAASAFEQALSRTPVLLGDVVVALGYARLRSGQPAAALAAAERARTVLPSQADELRARVALARGRPEEAEQQARAAQRDGKPSSMLVLAEVLVRRGDYRGALRVLDLAARRGGELGLPKVYNLEFLRADTLARLGRAAEAEDAYRREISGFPGNTLAYGNLAALYRAEGKASAVDSVLEDLVRANPNARAYRVAVATLDALGDRKKAAAWRRRAIEATPRP